MIVIDFLKSLRVDGMNDDDGRARAHKLIQSKMHHMDMSQQHLEAKYEHIIGTSNISSVNSSAAGCWSSAGCPPSLACRSQMVCSLENRLPLKKIL